jgi:hypothetical protein
MTAEGTVGAPHCLLCIIKVKLLQMPSYSINDAMRNTKLIALNLMQLKKGVWKYQSQTTSGQTGLNIMQQTRRT